LVGMRGRLHPLVLGCPTSMIRSKARAMAESLTDPEAKQLMFNVAADYEKLAKRAEDRSTGMKLP